MSKTWYPVINYETCEKCGGCIDKCTHGVYDVATAPIPSVIHGEECIQGCHGCGNICPDGAITYVGENTDWTPPNKGMGKKESYDGGCECEGKC